MAPVNFTPIHHLIKKHHQNTPPPSIGLPKEAEPARVNTHAEHVFVHESVEHTVEDAEVREIVTVHPETVHVPPQAASAGVQASGTASFTTQQQLSLPISEEKLPQGLHAPISSSLRWLSELTVYVLKSSYRGIKTAHHHVYGIFGGKK